jgi:hypothetical protein
MLHRAVSKKLADVSEVLTTSIIRALTTLLHDVISQNASLYSPSWKAEISLTQNMFHFLFLFNISSAFCICVFLKFLLISNDEFLSHRVNQLISVTVKYGVLCEARTEFVTIIKMKVGFRGLRKQLSRVSCELYSSSVPRHTKWLMFMYALYSTNKSKGWMCYTSLYVQRELLDIPVLIVFLC